MSNTSVVCIILKVDLSCCRGCKKWICKQLKRMEGVEAVKLEEDTANLIVSGERLDVTEVVQQVKRRKLIVELVSIASDANLSESPVHNLLPQAEAVHYDNSHEKGKDSSPVKPRVPPPEITSQVPRVDDHELQNRSTKADTLVTERLHMGVQGTKIRTRVTTSEDACTCIRLEETRFIIDKTST